MAFERTITAANSIFMLSITNLYPAPQLLQGYGPDAAFDTDASEPAEVVKGIDGRMSAGFVPFMTRQTITLMPDSPSSDLFERWIEAQKTAKDVYYANAVVTLPATRRTYTLRKGVLTSWLIIPGTRRVLQARQAIITWDDISPEPT